jgi:hypothetical protein
MNEFAGLTGRYGTILIDPPWCFANRTGKMAPDTQAIAPLPHHELFRNRRPSRGPSRAAEEPSARHCHIQPPYREEETIGRVDSLSRIRIIAFHPHSDEQHRTATGPASVNLRDQLVPMRYGRAVRFPLAELVEQRL